ncbi:hypothetical protein Q1695_014640 [Nippostrongylus brasiliensis]|nr:hypothetical protein Q1695_014640 [Nippostrongylus brasiliensis]
MIATVVSLIVFLDSERDDEESNDERKPLVDKNAVSQQNVAGLPPRHESKETNRGLFRARKSKDWKSSASVTKSSAAWGESEGAVQDTREDPLYITMLNFIMFCTLATKSEALWDFPRLVVQYGGVYFILIYLLMTFVFVFPLVHMELFVGQWCQSGAVKATRSYGRGFEFIGVMIVFLIFTQVVVGFDQSYYFLRHFYFILTDAENIVKCTKELGQGYTEHCVSMVNDKECRETLGEAYFFYEYRCINDSSRVTLFRSASKAYAKQLKLQGWYWGDYEISRPIYIGTICAIMTVVGILGFSFIRIATCAIGILYLIVILLMIIPFLSLEVGTKTTITNSLVTASTPESIFSRETYYWAFLYGIRTCGPGLSGLLCASSFRPRKSNAFLLTYAIFIVNLFYGLVVSFLFLALVRAKRSNVVLFSEDTSIEESLYFIGGVLTEVFLAHDVSPVWIMMLTLATYLFHLGAMSPYLICVLAFVRDHFTQNRRLWAISFSAASALVIFAVSFPLHANVEQVFIDLYKITIMIILFAILIVFVHIYGSREFMIDLCEVYELKEGEWAPRTATNSAQFYIYLIIPFGLLAAATSGIMAERQRYKRIVGDVVFKGVVILAVICFGWRLYENVKEDKSLGSFFKVNEEHPSYKRISSGWRNKNKPWSKRDGGKGGTLSVQSSDCSTEFVNISDYFHGREDARV